MSDSLPRLVSMLQHRGIAAPFDAAIVLGTGLGALADGLENPIRIPYSDLPGFPVSAVSGHAGTLYAGRLQGKSVLVLQGRVHYYEHGDARAMYVPLALISALKTKVLILTNSSGSVREETGPGAIVGISDHIAFSGSNPLIGESGDGRFVSMTDAYDPDIRAQITQAARAAQVPYREGVYMWFSGPSFETPAEIRMARTMGADLVGMSTVPEVILARYFGLRVSAISMVTNLAAGIQGASPTHSETKEIANASASNMQRIIHEFLRSARL